MLDTFSVAMVGIFDFGEFNPVPVLGVWRCRCLKWPLKCQILYIQNDITIIIHNTLALSEIESIYYVCLLKKYILKLSNQPLLQNVPWLQLYNHPQNLQNLSHWLSCQNWKWRTSLQAGES